MSSLQPLYDVKDRLEAAAIAGTGLLGEDFRLQRAAESMKPLAAASPVFGKISAGLEKLLSAPAEERPGLLLDVLSLVDAVSYTQGKSGADGEIVPLTPAGGTCVSISYSLIQPLLTALTTTGSGRVEIVKSTWEAHPEFFLDYRILPAVIAGLGDSYGEMADQNAKILEKLGPQIIPILKKDLDLKGKRAMARRVEVIAAIGGEMDWLRKILSEAKGEVRPEVIRALGAEQENSALLLDLVKSERGKSREAALESLAKMEGEDVVSFWRVELEKNGESVSFLQSSRTDWAAELAAAGLEKRLENFVSRGTKVETKDSNELSHWLAAIANKTGPSAQNFWRWTDAHMADICGLKSSIGQPLHFEENLSNILLYALSAEGGEALARMATQLWEQDTDRPRYLPHAFVAAFLTRSPEEVYDRFSPYLYTKRPIIKAAEKASQNAALLRGIFRLRWMERGYFLYSNSSFVHVEKTIDPRWIDRLTRCVWKDYAAAGQGQHMAYSQGEKVDAFDVGLNNLINKNDPQACAAAVPYFRERMRETGNWNAYSGFLLRLGASPAPQLKEALGKHGARAAYLYNIWSFCAEAAEKLPPEDVIVMLDAFLSSGKIRKEELPRAAEAIPFTQELLRSGQPYPAWEVWWGMGR